MVQLVQRIILVTHVISLTQVIHLSGLIALQWSQIILTPHIKQKVFTSIMETFLSLVLMIVPLDLYQLHYGRLMEIAGLQRRLVGYPT